MKRYAIFTVISLFVFMSSYCFAAGSRDSQAKEHQHEEEEEKDIELSGRLENGIRIIEVKAFQYKFEPDPIVVNQGEKVRLLLTSADVGHGIAIPEFKVNVSIPAGKTESVEFVADKKGSYHAHCSVYCGPGHAHMHATLIVK